MTSNNGRAMLAAVDRDAARRAATDLLRALGADVEAEGLQDTPRRVADAYAELLTPRPFRATTFPNEDGYDELIVARSIPFHSLCMHHLLPFQGVAHVGYLPGERILGLSKLAASSSTSPATSRFRSASPPRSPTGSSASSSRREWAWCSRPSTCACRCEGCRSWAPRP